jgi:hypothetical protein
VLLLVSTAFMVWAAAGDRFATTRRYERLHEETG